MPADIGAAPEPRSRRPAPPRTGLHGLPTWVVVPAVVGALFVVVPVLALTARLPGVVGPHGFWALVTSPSAADALALSLRTSLAATACCLVLGVPMALVLARARFPGRRIARALVLLPLVLPPVVGGIALLTTFGRRGVLGPQLSALGIELPFTTAAVVVAQTFVALPFLVLTLEGALRSHDTRYEDVAATLGARPSMVLRRVTLPRVLPALVSGTVLAFARALGEFGATITFAGSLQGVTQTLPLEIYLQRSADPDAAVALSLLLVVVALAIIVTVHGDGRDRNEGGRPRGSQSVHEVVPPAAKYPAWRGTSRPHGVPRGRTGYLGSGEETPSTPLPLTVRATLAARGLDVELIVPAGQVVAVLGENGAGKSTLLQVVAGLLHPAPDDAVHVALGDDVLTGPDGAQPPRRRGVGWLAQRPLVFGNLSVMDNVGFGPRARGASRTEARRVAADALSLVGAASLGERSGTRLSGGQAQRVCLARALATEPRILLLDEPFASLDVAAAQVVRSAVHEAQRARPRTTLLVTHDLLDVALLADRVVVLDGGRVVEDGPASEVLTRPRSRFAARLAGLDVVAGRVAEVRGTAVGRDAMPNEATPGTPPGGATPETDSAPAEREVTLVDAAGRPVVGTTSEPLCPDDPAVAVFEPRAVAVHRGPPAGSPRNLFPVVVTSIEPHGPLLRVWARAADAIAPEGTPDTAAPDATPDTATRLAADLTSGAIVDLRLSPGERVWFAVKAAEVRVHGR